MQDRAKLHRLSRRRTPGDFIVTAAPENGPLQLCLASHPLAPGQLCDGLDVEHERESTHVSAAEFDGRRPDRPARGRRFEPAFAEKLLAAAAQGDMAGGPPVGQHDSKNFWDSFGAVADASNAPRTRGLRKAPNGDANVASGRQVDFYHTTPTPRPNRPLSAWRQASRPRS